MLSPEGQANFYQVATTRLGDMDSPWCWRHPTEMDELAEAGLIANYIGQLDEDNPLRSDPRHHVWILTDLGKTLVIFILEGVAAA